MNNKKQFFSKLFLLGLGIGIVLGVNHIYAGNWNAPTASFPSGNVDAPINTGTEAQAKNGDLTLRSNLYMLNGSYSDGGNLIMSDKGGIVTNSILSYGVNQFGSIILDGLRTQQSANPDPEEKDLCSNEKGEIINCTYVGNEGTILPTGSSQDYKKCNIAGCTEIFGDTTSVLGSGGDNKIVYKKIDDTVFLDVAVNFVTNFENTFTLVAKFPNDLPKPLKDSGYMIVSMTPIPGQVYDGQENIILGQARITNKNGFIEVRLKPAEINRTYSELTTTSELEFPEIKPLNYHSKVNWIEKYMYQIRFQYFY